MRFADHLGWRAGVMFSVKVVSERRSIEQAYWAERERLRAFIDHPRR